MSINVGLHCVVGYGFPICGVMLDIISNLSSVVLCGLQSHNSTITQPCLHIQGSLSYAMIPHSIIATGTGVC